MTISPKDLFHGAVKAMPAKFFEYYNKLREQGYEHKMADIMAWAAFDEWERQSGQKPKSKE